MVSSILLKNLQKVAQDIEAQKGYLTELDSAIGDSDHGINMAKGFAAIDFSALSTMSIADIFKTIAMKLISTVGGASGPIYGTMFLEYAKASQGKNELDLATFTEMNEKAIVGIMARGGAKLHDKTLLDVLIPYTDTLKSQLLLGDNLNLAHQKALIVAAQKRDETKNYICNKGRASYLKERSIGHIDPGCASLFIILSGLL